MIKVFLVDDVRELRTLVRMVLEEDPEIHVVGEASNGLEGVEGVSRTQPDVVLLDLSMPDMDGLEAIPLMRTAAPNARLVVLSGHEAGRVSLEALQQGATRYVTKGAELDVIRAVVHEVTKLDPPLSDPRFRIIRQMWESFLEGRIDDMLRRAMPEARWRPYTAQGREFWTHPDLKQFIDELLSEGRVLDPRAYGVEPRGNGMIVRGTLEIRGPGGLSETELFWAFCFRGELVGLAGGFDSRDQAIETLRELCPG